MHVACSINSGTMRRAGSPAAGTGGGTAAKFNAMRSSPAFQIVYELGPGVCGSCKRKRRPVGIPSLGCRLPPPASCCPNGSGHCESLQHVRALCVVIFWQDDDMALRSNLRSVWSRHHAEAVGARPNHSTQRHWRKGSAAPVCKPPPVKSLTQSDLPTPAPHRTAPLVALPAPTHSLGSAAGPAQHSASLAPATSMMTASHARFASLDLSMEEGAEEEVGDSTCSAQTAEDGSAAGSGSWPPGPRHSRGRSCPAALGLLRTSNSSSALGDLAPMEEEEELTTPPSWSPALQVGGRADAAAAGGRCCTGADRAGFTAVCPVAWPWIFACLALGGRMALGLGGRRP